MNAHLKKRIQLFNLFSSNLDAELLKRGWSIIEADGQTGPYYICPLSLQLYTMEDVRSGDLTLEHVPPHSLGGKGLVLTGKSVNNGHGATGDAKLLKFFQGQRFNSGSGFYPIKLSKDVGPVKSVKALLNIKLGADKPSLTFVIEDKTMKAVKKSGWLEKWEGSSQTFTMTVEKIDTAAILKTAYLIAFSKLGYSLIFSNTSVYEPIQELLKFLSGEHEDYPVVLTTERLDTRGQICELFIENKAACIAVPVQFVLEGDTFDYVAMLPHPADKGLGMLRKIKSGGRGSNIQFRANGLADSYINMQTEI